MRAGRELEEAREKSAYNHALWARQHQKIGILHKKHVANIEKMASVELAAPDAEGRDARGFEPSGGIVGSL
jgi:hypothetical protein